MCSCELRDGGREAVLWRCAVLDFPVQGNLLGCWAVLPPFPAEVKAA